MGLIRAIKNLFKPDLSDYLSDLHTNSQKFKILITEFADNVDLTSGETIAQALQNKEGIDVSYYNKPFDKSFLNLDSRELFDWIDRGQFIFETTNADVIIWGYREGDKIRLNFQSPNQYEAGRKVFVSIMDSLYIPTNAPSAFITDIIYGAALSTINAKSETSAYRKYLLHKTIDKLIADNPTKTLGEEYTPYIMNFLGLIYFSYGYESTSNKDFKIIKEIFEEAVKYQEQIFNPIHLGCIYYHLGQLFDCAANNVERTSLAHFRGAIEYYVQAQKYLGKYNYPYEYGSICYRLSSLYFKHWMQKSDSQALRDAVFQLREAEKIYTEALFPTFWANIQENLGHLLSILGKISNSIDISELAIAAYKNKQRVITEHNNPISWAKTGSDIGDIYYHLGKMSNDKSYYEEALEYFHEALYIFENLNDTTEIKKINVSISKTNQNLNTLQDEKTYP